VKPKTTREAAEAAGISYQTLYNWLRAKSIEAPPVQLVGSKAVRLWTAEDIDRLRAWKRKHYNDGVGRPRTKKDGV
jgi:hypothetical protein